MIKIEVSNLIGKNAISMQSGTNLYKKISKEIFFKKGVELDFSGIGLFASPFFNASIGLLLKDISVEKLKIIHITPVGQQLLNLVITNAISFYKDKSTNTKTAQIVRESLNNN